MNGQVFKLSYLTVAALLDTMLIARRRRRRRTGKGSETKKTILKESPKLLLLVIFITFHMRARLSAIDDEGSYIEDTFGHPDNHHYTKTKTDDDGDVFSSGFFDGLK